MSHPALAQLYGLHYFDSLPATASPATLDWLLLEDSMTKRFETRCRKVSVVILREAFVGQPEMTDDESALLPGEPRYWLREILLCGDGVPWLAGRTLVPESTLNGPELALKQLGETPLGRYLFTSSTLTRDFIQTGQNEGLWGRRSRLRLSGKPLLLTELFLPAAPVYEEEEKWSGV
ncbi:chorismate lyase [Shimwellia blattae]|nr:chorismate lyase [Shimwellia blattae]GAB83057.1 chorismate--pyruvate lyase [Shimwellia blattae DSM 4481 = NBRC 105725]VDY66212.1 Chorismate--pyruvate lyase [Shimwellia blattae]VEC27357.1 Chorismate--pyruvate lyase [Shimwellia blattae]